MHYTDVPYIVYSAPAAYCCASCRGAGRVKVYFALCLLDHHVLGTGDTKDLALYRMMERYRAKYEPASPPLVREPGFEDARSDDDEQQLALGGFFS